MSRNKAVTEDIISIRLCCSQVTCLASQWKMADTPTARSKESQSKHENKKAELFADRQHVGGFLIHLFQLDSQRWQKRQCTMCWRGSKSLQGMQIRKQRDLPT
eukprot:c3929_g1_i1 orf=49-357(+)